MPSIGIIFLVGVAIAGVVALVVALRAPPIPMRWHQDK